MKVVYWYTQPSQLLRKPRRKAESLRLRLHELQSGFQVNLDNLVRWFSCLANERS